MFTKARWDKSFIFNSIRLRREWLMIQQHREEQDKISAEIEAALKKAEGDRFQPGSWIPAGPTHAPWVHG